MPAGGGRQRSQEGFTLIEVMLVVFVSSIIVLPLLGWMIMAFRVETQVKETSAEILAEKYNINAEVLDLRSIRPLDEEAIMASVRKTHRAICVEENKPFCGVGAQISSMIMEQAFDDLDAPVLRITSADAPAFYSQPIEKLQLPNPEEIVERALTIC